MTIPEYDYLDLGAGWQATEKVRVSLSILNVTDEDAPNVGQTIGGAGNNRAVATEAPDGRTILALEDAKVTRRE